VAEIDAAIVQQIFDVPERQRESDIHHDRQADDFRAAMKVLEWVAFCHDRTLQNHLFRLKPVLSDKAKRRASCGRSSNASQMALFILMQACRSAKATTISTQIICGWANDQKGLTEICL
jgi:hypothetical protein